MNFKKLTLDFLLVITIVKFHIHSEALVVVAQTIFRRLEAVKALLRLCARGQNNEAEYNQNGCFKMHIEKTQLSNGSKP